VACKKANKKNTLPHSLTDTHTLIHCDCKVAMKLTKKTKNEKRKSMGEYMPCMPLKSILCLFYSSRLCIALNVSNAKKYAILKIYVRINIYIHFGALEQFVDLLGLSPHLTSHRLVSSHFILTFPPSKSHRISSDISSHLIQRVSGYVTFCGLLGFDC